jgi:hypothetical protein
MSGNTTTSNNFTGLYGASGATVVPTTPYGNANVVSLLAAGTDGGNTVSNVVATGNVTANYFIGNGSQLTGIVSSTYGNAQVAAYLSSGTVTSNITTTANIAGSYILGNGSQLTGLPATYSNANVVSLLASFGSNSISTTGNITAGNFTGNGSALSSITGANVTGVVANATYALNANAATYATDAVQANYANIANSVAGANVSGQVANALVAGTVYTAAQPNITSLGTLTSLSSTGTISTTGNIAAQGTMSATGNIITAGYFVGNFAGNITGNLTVPGSNTQVIFNNNGNADAVGGFTYNKDSNTMSVLGVVSAQGNVIGGNVTTAGIFAGNGAGLTNIPGANVTGTVANATYANTAGVASYVTANAQANITSVGTLTSLNTSGNISATGNITGAYFLGNGSQLTGLPATYSNANVSNFLANFGSNVITTTGNIDGGNINGTNLYSTGVVSAAGNVRGGNINTVGVVTATGNIHGGNILTAGLISATGDITSGSGVFYGNGAGLTNINAGNIVGAYGNANVAANLAAFANNPISTSGNVTAGLFTGNGSALSSITGGNVTGTVANATYALNANAATFATNAVQANVANVANSVAGANVSGTVANATYALNSNAATFAGTVTTAAQPNITSVGTLTSLTSSGNISTTGNVTANYYIGNGSLLTGIATSSYSNADVSNFLANGFGSNTIVTTGNITAGNVVTTVVSATSSAGLSLKNSGGTTQASMGAGGGDNFAINVSTNLNGNNAQIDISPTGTGHVHIKPAGTGAVEIAPTSTGSINNMIIGNITPLAVNATTVSATGNITGNYFLGNGSQLTGIASTYGNANVSNFLANGFGSNTITTTGNVTGGNIIATANIYASNVAIIDGNIQGQVLVSNVAAGSLGLNVISGNAYIGGRIRTGLEISAAGDVVGANLLTTGQTSATGNVTGGNILTGGQVSATGNITGNYFLGNGSQLTGISASANAAGSNTQIQYNAAGAFAGNSLMTFDNTTGNVTLANLVIGTNIAGNVDAGGNAVRINPIGTYSGQNGNITSLSNSQMVIGNGAGNLNALTMGALIRSSQLIMYNVANVVEVANAGGVRYSQLAIGGAVQIGNLSNANTAIRAITSGLNVGGGPSANVMASTPQGIGQITAYQGIAILGNVGGLQPNVGNVTVNGAVGTSGFIQVNAGATANNAAGLTGTFINSGNITNALGVACGFTGTPITTPGNVFGYYMPTNSSTYGILNQNGMRAATNYYFLRNDDAVAQNQLGSLRAYHTFQALGTTTGTWDINKQNGQVQAVSLTGNVTIGSYTNFVTTANDSVNNDTQSDTVTLIIEQGATPYTVTMPTGNSAIRYASNVTTVANTANTTTMIAITAYRTAANATGYLTTISPGFV